MASLPALRQIMYYMIPRPSNGSNSLAWNSIAWLLQVCTRLGKSHGQSPKAESAEHLAQVFRRSAEKKSEPVASPAAKSIMMTLCFLEQPAAFLLLSSIPSLADQTAVWLRIATPKVNSDGPHIPLSDLFPRQRSFLPKQSPACNTVKSSTA